MNLETDVLIIGAGPAGMLSALMLDQAGVRSMVVERRLERSSAPRAHAVNPRTLEICERAGVPAERIRRAGAPRDEGGQVHFVATLCGTRFGSLPYERQDDAVRAFTPYPLTNIAQPDFEATLGETLEQCDGVSLLRGVSCIGVEQGGDGVSAALTARGSSTPFTINARYAVAADGAGSRTRDRLGIEMVGPQALQHYMMIHFEADLTEATRDRPGVLYFCAEPERSGVFIAYDRARTWVFMQSYDPSVQSAADFPDAVCKALIQGAVGRPVEDLVVRNVSPWMMSAQVADTYRVGRVFLVGDAAHRFPPTGGLGLNTGAGDAQNLCWKLAMVVKGEAEDGLLDTYQSERQAVARINSQQSLTNSAKLLTLFAALYGPDPARRATHFARVCSDPTAHGEIAAAVEMQRPHFDSLNLQLGYRYGAVANPESVPTSDYCPAYEVGDCLPHVPLRDGAWLLGKLPATEFSLLVGPQAQAWAGAGIPILAEGIDFEPSGGSWHEAAGLAADGALLIRPDGHIARRWQCAPADPLAALNTYWCEALGRSRGSRH